MKTTRRRSRLRAVPLLLLPLAALLACPPARAQVAPVPPALGKLEQLVGVWEVILKEPDGDGWRTAGPVFVEAATILRGHFVAMQGLFPLPGHETPLGMVLLFAQDPFQPVVRVSVLDDLVGLLDGFAGGWQGSELIVTNLACDTRWPGNVHGRLTLAMDGADRFEIRSESSTDRGATWRLSLIASFRRK